MRTQQRYIPFTILVGVLVLLASCGAPGLASSSPSPTQVLQNSVVAMSHVQSAHIDLQANVSTSSGVSAANPSATALSVTGHSDVVNPDKVSLNLLMGQSQLLSVIGIGQKVYIREKNGNWFFLDKSQIKDKEQSFFSQSLTQRMGQIMTLLQAAQLTDHGQESLNGVMLDHITATLDGQTLQDLSGQFNGVLSTGMPNMQNQLQQATLDVWIDQSTWYVHQAKLDLVAKVQTPRNGQQGQVSTVAQPFELKLQLNFSKWNEPVDIQAPANAVAFP